MKDIDFLIDEKQIVVEAPFPGISTTNLLEENIKETFSSAAAFPVALPPGLVYVGDKQSLVIFEKPPLYKEITYNFNLRSKALKQHNQSIKLPIPWQIYIGEFGTNGMLNALHFYFATNEIEKVSAPLELKNGTKIKIEIKDQGALLASPLPNVYDTNLVCLDKETYHPENSNLASKMNLMYASIWDTVFNADILVNTQKYYDYSNRMYHKISFNSTSNIMAASLKYWSRFSLEKVLRKDSSDNFFFMPTASVIKLSEFFTSTGTYKFFNTLQAIL